MALSTRDSGTSTDGSVLFGAMLRPLHSDEACGDAFLFLPAEDAVYFALVDGLGHGQQAHDAATETINRFAEHAEGTLEDIIWKTHREIRMTRGCAAFLGRISIPSLAMQCVSIGNITCKIKASGSPPLSDAGVLGHSLRRVTTSELRLGSGNMIVLSSDGISSKYELDELESKIPLAQAEEIVQQYGYAHDDASVLVIHIA